MLHRSWEFISGLIAVLFPTRVMIGVLSPRVIRPVGTLSLPTTAWPKSSKTQNYPTAKLFNNTACGRAAHHRSFVESTNPNPKRVSQQRSLFLVTRSVSFGVALFGSAELFNSTNYGITKRRVTVQEMILHRNSPATKWRQHIASGISPCRYPHLHLWFL